MFERIKMDIAASRAIREKRARNRGHNSDWVHFWNLVCWPLDLVGAVNRWLWDMICRFFRWLWRWLCSINVVGLLNAVLLVAIIVLCSMLIINIVNCYKKPVVIVSDPVPASVISEKINVPVVAEPITKPVEKTVVKASVSESKDRIYTLPAARNGIMEPVRVSRAPSDPMAFKQTARINNRMYGDVIIDSRGAARMLNNGDEIDGNLYLQHMRKYVLPCNVKITGNMFIRDVNMLQFCGEFEITGNIYVTPTSSFGPIPRNAHVGGQIVL